MLEKNFAHVQININLFLLKLYFYLVSELFPTFHLFCALNEYFINIYFFKAFIKISLQLLILVVKYVLKLQGSRASLIQDCPRISFKDKNKKNRNANHPKPSFQEFHSYSRDPISSCLNRTLRTLFNFRVTIVTIVLLLLKPWIIHELRRVKLILI